VDQFSSIISVLDHQPTGSLFVDHLDHDLFVKNKYRHAADGHRRRYCQRLVQIMTNKNRACSDPVVMSNEGVGVGDAH
jgi:hypothetical protein